MSLVKVRVLGLGPLLAGLVQLSLCNPILLAAARREFGYRRWPLDY